MIRDAYMQRDTVPSNCTEFDARRTEREPVSHWQTLANAVNDESIKIKWTVIHDSWGSWWKESMDCSWDELRKHGCEKIRDGKDMKDKHAEIINSLGGMYMRWNLSGNGDDMCGKNMEIGETGVYVQHLPTQGDQIDFLNHRHPICLFAWYHLLKADLWQTACTEFPKEFRADGEEVPSVGGDDDSTTSSRASAAKRQQLMHGMMDESKKMRKTLVKAVDLQEKSFDLQNWQYQVSSSENRCTNLNMALAAAKMFVGEKKKEYNALRLPYVKERDQESKVAIQEIMDDIQKEIDRASLDVSKYETQLETIGNEIDMYQGKITAAFEKTPVRSNMKLTNAAQPNSSEQLAMWLTLLFWRTGGTVANSATGRKVTILRAVTMAAVL